jgi:hypothetical protein
VVFIAVNMACMLLACWAGVTHSDSALPQVE